MNDLTKPYKTLQLLHSSARKHAMSIIFTKSKDIVSTHPLIVKMDTGINLQYTSEYKEIQKRLVNEIKTYLYNKAIEPEILSLIKETNIVLQTCKRDNNRDDGCILQSLVNTRVNDVIKKYIKNNLLVFSYIKDIQTLRNKKDLTRLENEEIESLKKQVHHLITK